MATISRSRQQAAKAHGKEGTRRRVITAATACFERDGYLQTTMADVAREAGVAVQTLYLSFGSKIALLAAAPDVAIAGDDEPIPIMERGWYRACIDEPQAPAAVAGFVDGASRVIARHHRLFAAMLGSSADPEVGQLLAANKSARLTVHRRFAVSVIGKPGARPGLRPPEVTNTVYALVSPECFGLLVGERGMSRTRWRAWVLQHLAAEILIGGNDSGQR